MIYNLNANKDWVFIGDGKNDIHIAEKAPLSYGINPHPELAKIVDFNASCFNELYIRLIDDEDVYITDDNDLVQDEEFSGVEAKDKMWERTVAELENAQKLLATKDEEVKSIESEIEYMNGLLAIASSENQEKEGEIIELRRKFNSLRQEKIELHRKKDAAEKRVEKEEKSRRKKIKDLWDIHFRHFSFTTAFLSEVAKLHHDNFLKLEEKLLELYEARDPRALSRSKYHDSGNDHLGLTLLGGVATRVHYRIVHGQQHKVEILEFENPHVT